MTQLTDYLKLARSAKALADAASPGEHLYIVPILRDVDKLCAAVEALVARLEKAEAVCEAADIVVGLHDESRLAFKIGHHARIEWLRGDIKAWRAAKEKT